MAEDNKDEIQLVVFKLGSEEFGVDISQVREIIKTVNITKIPNSPEFIEGVINLRGQTTTVMDLRKKLDILSQDENPDQRIIITEFRNDHIGMIVDSVEEVLRISTGYIDTQSIATSQVESEYILGVGNLENRLLILLDLGRVLNSREAVSVEKAIEAA